MHLYISTTTKYRGFTMNCFLDHQVWPPTVDYYNNQYSSMSSIRWNPATCRELAVKCHVPIYKKFNKKTRCRYFAQHEWISLYSLIWDFLLSQINIWTTTTWSNVWVVLPKPSWYDFLIGFLIWTLTSKYLHLTTFSNICVILSMFLYL